MRREDEIGAIASGGIPVPQDAGEPGGDPSQRRKYGRIKAGKLGCNRGEVLDISGGGVRLLRTRRMEGRVRVELWGRINRIAVEADVVWCRRTGFRRYEVGLEFVDLDDAARRTLSSFASFLRNG